MEAVMLAPVDSRAEEEEVPAAALVLVASNVCYLSDFERQLVLGKSFLETNDLPNFF